VCSGLAFFALLRARKALLGAPLLPMPAAVRATLFAASFAIALPQLSLGPASAGIALAMLLAAHRPVQIVEGTHRWLKIASPRRSFSARPWAIVAPVAVPFLAHFAIGVGVTDGAAIAVACLAWLPLFFWSSSKHSLQRVRAQLGRKCQAIWLGQHDSTALRLAVIEPTGTIEMSVSDARAKVRVIAPMPILSVLARGARLAAIPCMQRDLELEIETPVRFCAEWVKWCVREMRAASEL
jgi:hypothetical protein